MRCFYLILTSAALLTTAALAGPSDVTNAPQREPEGALQPHHQLYLPSARAQNALPDPTENHSPDIAPTEITVGESQSLLAYQGLLNPEDHGFREDVWLYMKASEAMELLAALPKTISLSPLRARLVDLLLLEAQPPHHATDRWLTARLAALQRFGAADQAARLLESVPGSLRDAMRIDALFEFFLKNKQVKLACEAAQAERSPENISQAQWARIQLYCNAALGRYSKVELALALAEEQGKSFSPWFVKLLEQFQYDSVKPPVQGAGQTAFDQLMIAAVRSTQNEEPDAEVLPKTPSYAMLAIARLIRDGKAEQTAQWLSMLERTDDESASTYVAHELVRFYQTDPNIPQSIAARTLPPFSGTESASKADLALLIRFFSLVEAFGYIPPAVTMEWISQQNALAGDGTNPDAMALSTMAEVGNKAGYLLSLTSWLNVHPINTLSNDALTLRIEELLRLGEDAIARQLAAEAILVRLE